MRTPGQTKSARHAGLPSRTCKAGISVEDSRIKFAEAGISAEDKQIKPAEADNLRGIYMGCCTGKFFCWAAALFFRAKRGGVA